MRKLQNQRALKRLIYSRPVIALLLVGILFSLRSVWLVFRQSREVDARQQLAATRLGELENRRRELEQEIASLKTPRGIESEIREIFPVAKEGEEVITIVEQPATTEVEVQKSGFWGWIVSIFE